MHSFSTNTDHNKWNVIGYDKSIAMRIALIKKRQAMINEQHSHLFLTMPKSNSFYDLNPNMNNYNSITAQLCNHTKTKLNQSQLLSQSMPSLLKTKSKSKPVSKTKQLFDLTQMSTQPKFIFKSKLLLKRAKRSFNNDNNNNKSILNFKKEINRSISLNKARCKVNPNLKHLDKLYKYPIHIEKDLIRIKSNKANITLSDYQRSLYRIIYPILSEAIAKQLQNTFITIRSDNKSCASNDLMKTMIDIEAKEEKLMKEAGIITNSAQFLMNNCNRHGRQKVKLSKLQFKRVIKPKYNTY